MDHKKCSKCNIILTDEIKTKNKNECKSCTKIKYKEYVDTKLTEKYNLNVERKCNKCSIILNQENQVKNRPNCKSCYNTRKREYKKNNKEKISENNKKYYIQNKENISEYYKNHYIQNKDKYLENNRKWRDENREIINKKANERFANNPIAKLKKVCRTRIYNVLKGKCNNSTLKLIDCEPEFLLEWLQYNFKESMNFKNHGSFWHIDHVIPCTLFNLEDSEEIIHCFRWTNLQPLEGSINTSKQNKLDKTEVIEHYKRVKQFADLHNIILKDFNFEKYF